MTNILPLKSWAPRVYESLTSLIPTAPGLVCFDFDNTLIRNDFGEKLMESIILEGMKFLPPNLSANFRDKDFWTDHTTKSIDEKAPLIWEEYTYQLKEFGIERGYRWTSFIFQGLSKPEFYATSRRTWDKVSFPRDEAGVFPQAEMTDLIRYLLAYGWDIYIVTASPETGIAAIADHFSVAEDHILGMRLEQTSDRNGTRIIEPYTYGEGKVEAIRSRIGKFPDLAFGDSMNDFPMLCSAKKLAVAIDRGSPEFTNACRNKEILIQPYFTYATG